MVPSQSLRAILVNAAACTDQAFPWRSAEISSRGLEFAHHLQHRAEHPAIGDHLVLILARVAVEVKEDIAQGSWHVSKVPQTDSCIDAAGANSLELGP